MPGFLSFAQENINYNHRPIGDFPGNRFLFTRVPCVFYVCWNLMAKTTAG